MEQADEITRIAGKLDGVEDKLRDLLNSSRHSIDNSQAALDIVKRGEDKKRQIQVGLFPVATLAESRLKSIKGNSFQHVCLISCKPEQYNFLVKNCRVI